MRKRANWVLDADVRDFFGSVDHGWMMKFVKHRIADRRIHRVIQKWLKAGAVEQADPRRRSPAACSKRLAVRFICYRSICGCVLQGHWPAHSCMCAFIGIFNEKENANIAFETGKAIARHRPPTILSDGLPVGAPRRS